MHWRLNWVTMVFFQAFAFNAVPAFAAAPAQEEKVLGTTRPVEETRQSDDGKVKTLGTTRPAKAMPVKPGAQTKPPEITIVPIIKIRPSPTHAPQ